MFVHSEKLNPCKCGSKKAPDLDSDDMVPCWGVRCYDCGQFQHHANWTMHDAVTVWNKENPVKAEIQWERNTAVFSEDRTCRFVLLRIWDPEKPKAMVIGLNPSTANEKENDRTIERMMQIAAFNGYGGMYMMNTSPYVSTDPNKLIACHSYDSDRNEKWFPIIRAACKDVIFAWGNFKQAYPMADWLMEKFPEALCLGQNKNGSPKHPLYLLKNTPVRPFVRK